VVAAGEPAGGVVRYYVGDDPETGVTKQWYRRSVDVAPRAPRGIV